jgi:hypothetical protein
MPHLQDRKPESARQAERSHGLARSRGSQGGTVPRCGSILIRPEKSRMTRYLFLVLLVVMPIGGSTQQKSEPSPTVEQCRSDIDSWLADRWNTSRLSFLKIQARTVELGACGATYHQLLRWKENPSDTSPGKTSDLEALESIYDGETNLRYSSFIDRHGLLSQFYEEDEAGKR